MKSARRIASGRGMTIPVFPKHPPDLRVVLAMHGIRSRVAAGGLAATLWMGAAAHGRTTYFIDPANGDDARGGTTREAAWRGFAPLHGKSLAPGDVVEVIAPGALHHTLDLQGEGTAERPIRVRLAPGRYDFHPGHAHREAYQISNTNDAPDEPKAVAIRIVNAAHLHLSGHGATLVQRGKAIHVCIDASRAVTVEGLAFDYHRPTVSEFTVTGTGADTATLTIHPDSAYTLEDGNLTWRGEGWSETTGLAQQLDPATGRVHRLRDPLAGLRFEEIAPFRLRAHGPHKLVAGRVYQIRNPFRDCAGVFTRGSADVTWRDVDFRFMHGMGIVSQFSENLTFERVRIAPDPAGGRTTAAWADGIQASGCRGKILVVDCVFQGAHDDAINIHGTHLRVVGLDREARRVRVRFMHRQTFGFMAFHPGDAVEFVHADTLATYGANEVTHAELLNPTDMALVLRDPLPLEFRENDVLENVTWTPSVEIRGCKVAHIPTRGFLITTRRPVRVEDNDFHATHMPAILIENDATGWYESGAVRDMRIVGNRFHHCGEPAIHIHPRNAAPNAAVHRNIRIEGNTFHLRRQLAVGANSTTGLAIIGNTIHPPAPIEGDAWLKIEDCAEVTVEGNSVEEPGAAPL